MDQMATRYGMVPYAASYKHPHYFFLQTYRADNANSFQVPRQPPGKHTLPERS